MDPDTRTVRLAIARLERIDPQEKLKKPGEATDRSRRLEAQMARELIRRARRRGITQV